jgi:hypothetical protein
MAWRGRRGWAWHVQAGRVAARYGEADKAFNLTSERETEMARGKTEHSQEIQIAELKRGELRLRIIGETPLFQNRMSAKVKQGLLVGSRKKTKVEKLAIKHDPYQEFRDSAEVVATGPTALGLRVTAIKSAMCSAAIETAGLTKAGTQRLLFMPGDHCPLFGIPQLRMDVTRSADINRTPDIRTRAFLPKWGAEIHLHYIIPQLSAQAVITLLANAGLLIGVGDYRQEKGKGAFGSFRVLDSRQDDEWDHLVSTMGREAQESALANPEPADDETAELLDFCLGEQQRRAA